MKGIIRKLKGNGVGNTEPDTELKCQDLQRKTDQELNGTHGAVIAKHLSVGKVVADHQ